MEGTDLSGEMLGDMATMGNLCEPSLLVGEAMGEKPSKVSDQRYKCFGVRYLIFSKQFHFYRDLNRHVYKTPPVLVKNQVIFNSSAKFDIFTYNIANVEETSKSRFDLTLLKVLLSTPITFSRELYEVTSQYFEERYTNRRTIANNTKLRAINQLLSQLFKGEGSRVTLYFPFVMDFRGRIYVDSPLSITDVKLLRYLITPCNVIYTRTINQNMYYRKFKDLIPLLGKLGVNTRYFGETEKIIILLGLLNLGKLLKSKLIGGDIGVSLEAFIEQGISIFNFKTDDLCIRELNVEDIDDIAEIITLRLKLKNYIEKREPFSVLLDSTASGIFHLNLWLNARDEYQTYLNLSGEWR